MSAESLAQIAVARPVQRLFTYRLPEGMGPLIAGQRVHVPFGKGQALGFYLGEAPPPASQKGLKPVLAVLERRPALPADVLKLAAFAAEHYRYPLGEVLRAALPPGLTRAVQEEVVDAEAQAFVSVLPAGTLAAEKPSGKRAPVQAAALSYLLAIGGAAPVSEVVRAVPGARDALKRMAARGLLAWEERLVERWLPPELAQQRPERLTPAQESAVQALSEALAERQFRPYLLQGVTGSGKTEVYLRAVEEVLRDGGGALVLVPEIALTPQLVGRFSSRFGNQVAVLHSGLKDRERTREWQLLREGKVRVAVGVRSAIFAPVQDLRLVVVDEEHDASFKQEEKLKYQARDLAIVRAKQTGAVVILGSATPSLETLENARRGRYRMLELRERVASRPLPRIDVVDLRHERPEVGSVLSARTLEMMGDTLARGQQVILFLNRRGHSTFLLCSACGVPVRCHQCDVSLTHHLSKRRVLCHYCGESRPVPTECSECQGELLHLGAGTEKLESEVGARFPRARVGRLDRDAVTNAEELTQVLSTFARRELDVLIGTQMVAKGHDFPGVTLVVVVLADTALSLPDFRAAERTFQLLTQVGGRAGRGSEPGRVVLQTYNPEAPCIERVVQHDYEGFADQELTWRKALSYPPFARLAALRIESADEQEAARTARALSQQLGRRLTGSGPGAGSGVRMLGPALAPLARLRGKARWQLLLKAPSHAVLHPLLELAEQYARTLPQTVRVLVDVDPWALL